MRAARCGAESLSGKIFASVLVFALGVAIVLAAAMTTAFYFSYEHDAEEKLAAQAQDAAGYLNATPSAENAPALSEQFAGTVRYTLVAPDGRVLFDSAADRQEMGNHAQRPEIQQALASGEAVSLRYSDTLKTDTVYAAVKLEDGSVVRLSETRHSLLAFLGGMVVPVAAALALIALLAFFLSRALTERIMKPIDALNFAEPLHNDIYEEMEPLLVRIDEQQRQLRQQNAELAEAENLRRDFSSNVSHEMKTPLQVISGYAELMKNDMVDPADRQRFAGLIYEEAQAMRALIDNVLTLSRLDESAAGKDAALVNMREVACRVRGRLQSFAAERGVAVRVEGEAVRIAGSETLVEEMLYNLVENGIRYNRPGGEVAVELAREAAGAFGGHAPRADAPAGGGPDGMAPGDALAGDGRVPSAGDAAVVRVRDTGAGIPAELHDKVFERFFRVDKSRSKETGGTGLGLAIVKHAVLYHHGTIEVKSAEGAGASFVLRFPAA